MTLEEFEAELDRSADNIVAAYAVYKSNVEASIDRAIKAGIDEGVIAFITVRSAKRLQSRIGVLLQ